MSIFRTQLRTPGGTPVGTLSRSARMAVWALVALPPLLAWGGPLRAGWATTVEVVVAATAVAVALAAALAYLTWRIAGSPAAAVLAASLTAVATNAAAVGVCLLCVPWDPARLSAWLLVEQAALAVVAGGVLCYVVVRGTEVVRHDPVLAGLLLGLIAACASITAFVASAPLRLPRAAVPVVAAALLAVCAVVVLVVVRRVPRHPRAFVRTATVVGCLTLGQLALHLPHTSTTLGALVVLHVVGTALLVSTCAARLQQGLLEQETSVRALERTVEQSVSESRLERATLHEIRATVAGIAGAAALVAGADLSVERRRSLQVMVDDELERLTRLLDGRAARVREPLDLDPVLRTVVLRAQAGGVDVRWAPSSLRVLAARDDVAEVVGILLENARRHAPGATVHLDVEVGGDALLLRVRDTGPGVDDGLGEGVFVWGARAPGSPGQGIGLAMARQRARELGGDLLLEPRGADPGAAFCWVLPRTVVRNADGAALCTA